MCTLREGLGAARSGGVSSQKPRDNDAATGCSVGVYVYKVVERGR